MKDIKRVIHRSILVLIGGIEINVMNDAVMFVQCTGSDGTVAEWDMDLKPTEIGDDGEYIYYYGKGIKMSYYPSDHHIHVDGENNYFGDYYPNDNEIGLQNCGSCRERQLFSCVDRVVLVKKEKLAKIPFSHIPITKMRVILKKIRKM